MSSGRKEWQLWQGMVEDVGEHLLGDCTSGVGLLTLKRENKQFISSASGSSVLEGVELLPL